MVVIENEIDMKRTTKSISVSSQHSPPAAVLLLPQLLLPAALLVHRGTNLSRYSTYVLPRHVLYGKYLGTT